MTRSTNMEHVEVLRELEQDGDAGLTEREREAIRQVIASLSAPQPPAEAQPVAWEWEYVGNGPYPRGKTVARALHEMDPQNPPYPETWRPTRPLVYGDASPQQPAAGVGEEIMVNAAHDVFILPLQPSGLSSGPRFVVHVPGPEQPVAVDGDDFDCLHSAFDNCDCYADQQGGSDNDR